MARTRVLQGVVWLVAVGLVACGDDDGPAPNPDGGTVDMGRGDMGAPPPECTVDADCADGEVCSPAGACVAAPECMVDGDCPTGQVCTPAGVCAPEPTECTTDADCDPDGLTGGLFLCMDGTCGSAPLDTCPDDALLARVCRIAARDTFCAGSLFVSCGDAASCEACDGECDPDAGCAAPPTDMGPRDAGPPADMGPIDSGPPADTGPIDSGPADTGPADMGPADTGPADMGPADMGPTSECGNGVVEPGEDCDGPASPTCTEPGCDTSCHRVMRTPTCGDGCSDPGEACGEPGLPMCAGGSACASCGCVVTCGNGTADPGEQCRDGSLTCAAGSTCNDATCRCVPNCGNGTLDPGEACDPPAPATCASSTYCTPTCQLAARPAMCGNGCIDGREECGEPGLDACPPGSRCGDCACVPNCGNGLLDLGETCDPPQPPPGGAQGCPATYCASTCQVEPRPRACGNGCAEAGEECGDPGTAGCSMGFVCSASCECELTIRPRTTLTATQSAPTAILDTTVVTTTLVVSGFPMGDVIEDVNLQTFIQHTFAADLDITLTSPAGTVVTITSDNGGSNDNVFDGTIWDDDANPGGQVPYGSNNGLVTDHAYTNLVVASPLVPEEALGAFVGESPNGTWTLTVSDDLGGDTGSVNAWSLTIVTTPPPTTAGAITNTTVPLAIPTGPAVVSQSVTPGALPAGVLCDLNVVTMITHTFAADLEITLTSPAGTVVTLTTDNGGSTDNVFNGTLWDDDANPGGTLPYTANNGLATDQTYVNLTTATPLVPEEALAAFIGEDPNGTWTLTISDDLAGDGGSLDSWDLQFTICNP